jgi:predicted LPLAT superfamily acyltransferase
MADWRKIPEAGTVVGIRLVVVSARVLGRRIAGWILYVPAFWYALVHGAARRASRDYLRRVGQPASLRHVIRHIHTFAKVSLDRLFFLTGRMDRFRFEHTNHDVLIAQVKSGRGAVLIGAHLGSFEVMRSRANDFDVPIHVVVDWSNAERINGVLRKLAPDIDTRLISLAHDPVAAMLAIKAAIDRGELVAILGDRTPAAGPGARVVHASFLGAQAPFPSGPWMLAHTLDCPVFFVAGLFEPPNTYALYLEPLADRVKLARTGREAAAAGYAAVYAAMLERYVRKAPMNWFNFYDFWSES